MLFGLEPFDPSTFVGVFGLIAGPLVLIVGGLAAYKVQDAARWRSAAEAEKVERESIADGIRIRDERLRSTNEWAAQIEARYNEKEQLVAALNERVSAQAEHIAKLLERTPEKLWESVERHSAAAEAQWALARDFQLEAVTSLNEKLDAILERVSRIEPD